MKRKRTRDRLRKVEFSRDEKMFDGQRIFSCARGDEEMMRNRISTKTCILCLIFFLSSSFRCLPASLSTCDIQVPRDAPSMCYCCCYFCIFHFLYVFLFCPLQRAHHSAARCVHSIRYRGWLLSLLCLSSASVSHSYHKNTSSDSSLSCVQCIVYIGIILFASFCFIFRCCFFSSPIMARWMNEDVAVAFTQFVYVFCTFFLFILRSWQLKRPHLQALCRFARHWTVCAAVRMIEWLFR